LYQNIGANLFVLVCIQHTKDILGGLRLLKNENIHRSKGM